MFCGGAIAPSAFSAFVVLADLAWSAPHLLRHGKNDIKYVVLVRCADRLRGLCWASTSGESKSERGAHMVHVALFAKLVA